MRTTTRKQLTYALHDIVNAITHVPRFENAMALLYSDTNMSLMPPQVVAEMALVAFIRQPTMRVRGINIRSYALHYMPPILSSRPILHISTTSDSTAEGIPGIEIFNMPDILLQQVCRCTFAETPDAGSVCIHGNQQYVVSSVKSAGFSKTVIVPTPGADFQDAVFRAVHDMYNPDVYLAHVLHQMSIERHSP